MGTRVLRQLRRKLIMRLKWCMDTWTGAFRRKQRIEENEQNEETVIGSDEAEMEK